MFPEQPIHWECDEAFLLFLIPPLLTLCSLFFLRKYLKTENDHSKIKNAKLAEIVPEDTSWIEINNPQAFPLFLPTTNRGSCVHAESCVQGHMANAPSKITFKHLWFHENGGYNLNLASSFSFYFLWNRTEAKNFIVDSEHYRQKRKTTLNWVRK